MKLSCEIPKFVVCFLLPICGVAGTPSGQQAALGQATRPSLPQRLGTPSTAPTKFENVIKQSGINFVLNNSVSSYRYSIETMAGGVAVFDYDNDGLLDIFFTNGADLPSLDKSSPTFSNRLFHNNGDGTFTDVTSKAGLAGMGYSMGVAAADYDNDGFVDLYVTGVNHNQLFRNNGDGTFTDVTSKTGGQNTAARFL